MNQSMNGGVEVGTIQYPDYVHAANESMRTRTEKYPRTPEGMKAMIRDSGLSREEVANMLGIGVSTLAKYLLPVGSSNHRDVPEVTWRLMRLLLGHDDQLKVVMRRQAREEPELPPGVVAEKLLPGGHNGSNE